jgi:hypothetical protein
VEIMRATVSNDGRYTVTLSGAIDHPPPPVKTLAAWTSA